MSETLIEVFTALNKVYEEQKKQAEETETTIESSVVKVYTQRKKYNFYDPWKPASFNVCRGSGFVIDNKKILTNYHVVENHAFVEVRLANDPTRYIATVEKRGPDCDLAQLTVSNPKFWLKAKSLSFGSMPKYLDDVQVYGFPIGGDDLSITRGIVSRIVFDEYVTGKVKLIAAQVDAAINGGNSGGAAISQGKVVGVIHQSIHSAQSVGYIIPVPVVEHFLKDGYREAYRGFPELAISTQSMESEALRHHYGMKKEQSGVLVTGVDTLSPAEKLLKEEDVILKIKGIPVNNDETVIVERGVRIHYEHVIRLCAIGETIPITVWRDKKEVTVNICLTNPVRGTKLVPPLVFDNLPEYYIVSGLILQPLTPNFLIDGWGSIDNAPTALSSVYYSSRKKSADDQAIIINRVLLGEVTSGYQDVRHVVIKTVNGQKVKNMKETIKAFEDNREKYHIVTTDYHDKIVIRNITRPEHQLLLDLYDIQYDRSRFLRPILQAIPMQLEDSGMSPGLGLGGLASSLPGTSQSAARSGNTPKGPIILSRKRKATTDPEVEEWTVRYKIQAT